jgi:hypothetical protein
MHRPAPKKCPGGTFGRTIPIRGKGETMADAINIISRTQTIIVERGAGAVAVISAGPVGPGGPPGSGIMNWAFARVVDNVPTTTYTIVPADAGKIKRLMAVGDSIITLPSGGFSTGQSVDFLCVSSKATFVLGTDAIWDVVPSPSNVARAIGSFVTVIKMSPTAWALRGDLEGP